MCCAARRNRWATCAGQHALCCLQSVLGPFGRRGALLAIMFGGAALVSSVVRRAHQITCAAKHGGTVLHATHCNTDHCNAEMVFRLRGTIVPSPSGWPTSCAGDDPSVVTTKEGITVATTPSGNPVAVYSDDNGNIFLIDPNGNLYYDTGDPQLGFYFVSHALLQM